MHEGQAILVDPDEQALSVESLNLGPSLKAFRATNFTIMVGSDRRFHGVAQRLLAHT